MVSVSLLDSTTHQNVQDRLYKSVIKETRFYTLYKGSFQLKDQTLTNVTCSCTVASTVEPWKAALSTRASCNQFRLPRQSLGPRNQFCLPRQSLGRGVIGVRSSGSFKLVGDPSLVYKQTPLVRKKNLINGACCIYVAEVSFSLKDRLGGQSLPLMHGEGLRLRFY